MNTLLISCVTALVVVSSTAASSQEPTNVIGRVDSMLLANNVPVDVPVLFVPHRQVSCITCGFQTVATIDSIINCLPEPLRKDVVVLYVVGVARKIEWAQAMKTVRALAKPIMDVKWQMSKELFGGETHCVATVRLGRTLSRRYAGRLCAI